MVAGDEEFVGVQMGVECVIEFAVCARLGEVTCVRLLGEWWVL